MVNINTRRLDDFIGSRFQVGMKYHDVPLVATFNFNLFQKDILMTEILYIGICVLHNALK